MNTQKAVPIIASLLRIVAGVLFLQAGGLKLFGWFGGMPGGATDVTNWHWKYSGICRWKFNGTWFIYKTCCFYSGRRNGSCLFSIPRAKRTLANTK